MNTKKMSLKRLGEAVLAALLAVMLCAAFMPSMQGHAAGKPGKAKITSTKLVKHSYINVKWKKVKGASGYQFAYLDFEAGADPGDPGDASIMKKVNVGSKTYYHMKAKNYRGYYYQVRAYRKVGSKKVYGKWSQSKTCMIYQWHFEPTYAQ